MDIATQKLAGKAYCEVEELILAAEWGVALRDVPEWARKNVKPLFEKGGKYEGLDLEWMASRILNAEKYSSETYSFREAFLVGATGDPGSWGVEPLNPHGRFWDFLDPSPELDAYEEARSDEDVHAALNKIAAKYGL